MAEALQSTKGSSTGRVTLQDALKQVNPTYYKEKVKADIIKKSKEEAEKYYQEANSGLLNKINNFVDPLVGSGKAVIATTKDMLTPWDNSITPSVQYQGVEYKTPAYKGAQGGAEIADGNFKKGFGMVGEGVLDVAQFLPIGGAVVRGATKGIPILQVAKNLATKKGAIETGKALIKNKSIQQNAALMGGYGVTGAMQEDKNAAGIALEGAKGVGLGVGIGLGFEGLGAIAGIGFRKLFEKIGTREKLPVEPNDFKDALDGFTETTSKPPTPEEENAILEALSRGATKDDIVEELGKAKLADSLEPKPRLAEVVDQIEGEGVKLDLEQTQKAKTLLEEGKGVEEIKTELLTPESEKVKFNKEKEPLTASSYASYIDNDGNKVVTRLSDRELEVLADEIRTIPTAKDGNSQIHLDARTPVLEEMVNNGEVKMLNRDEFVSGHPQAKEVFNVTSKTSLEPQKQAQETPKVEKVDTVHDRLKSVAKMEKDSINSQRMSAEQKSSRLKASGMEYSAISRMLRREPTGIEERNARKYLESNYNGKPVRVNGIEATATGKVSFGNYEFKMPDGTLKTFTKDKITPEKVSRVDILDHLEFEGKKKLEGRENIYGIKPREESKVKSVDKVEEKKAPKSEPKRSTEKEETKKEAPKEEKKKEEAKKETSKTPEKKTSVIASRLNKDLPDDFKFDDTYDAKVIKSEIEKAANEIADNKGKAIKKAFDPNTNPVERDAILIELSEIAKRDGDWTTVSDLFQKRSELIRSSAQSLNMEKASILLNPEESYMRKVVNSLLAKVKIDGKDLTEAQVSATRKSVKKRNLRSHKTSIQNN